MHRRVSRLGVACLASAMALGAIAVDRPGATVVQAAAAAADSAPCVDGYRLIATNDVVSPDSLVKISARRALLAGGANLGWGRRAATIASYRDGEVRRVARFVGSGDTAFMGMDGSAAAGFWAVGYARDWKSVTPISVRKRANGKWKRAKLPRPKGGGAALTDVASTGSTRTWAVGFRVGRPGRRRPWVLKWRSGKWVTMSPGLLRGERGMLAGVSANKRGGTWITGWTSRNGRISPYIARRKSGRWQRLPLPSLGDAALADIEVVSAKSGWAVGYQTTSSGMKPLVLRWDGTQWKEHAGPDSGDGATLLTSLSLEDGKLTVTGTTWHQGTTRLRALVATLEQGGWSRSVARTMPSHAVITAIDGDPSDGGWAAGKASKVGGLVVRTCGSNAGPARTRSVRKQRKQQAAAEIGTTGEGHGPGEGAAPSPRAGLASVPALEFTPASGLRIRDRTKAVGLPVGSLTWGAVIDDFDGDGRDDIFLGRHGHTARLYLDRGPKYELANVIFGKGDRHGCASADVDGSGLPDLYCGLGAARGSGVKANQLWLDPGGADPRKEPLAGGAIEPLGRGRYATFIDVDVDGKTDLFVGQKPGRVDGLPSANRVYRRVGPAAFDLMRSSGIDPDIGVHALDTADIDLDGRRDMALLYYDQRAQKPRSGLRLYRNTTTGFKDVTTRYRIRAIGERDVELVRLDHDKLPDLVQLSEDRIRVSLQRNGRFVKVFERQVAGAAAVAAGDADGDGDQDLYILRQKDRKGDHDILLLNRGNGRSYRAIKMPSVRGGAADDVFPIDHDQNGTTDFLVLNGVGSVKGPVQLIAFYN